MKSPTQRNSLNKVFSKSNSLFVVFDFSPSLHDLIISHCVKHPPINLPQKVCSLVQRFFMKKIIPYFVGERREYTLSSYLFPFLKASSLTLAVQNIIFKAKLPSHCFQIHTIWFWNFPNCLILNCKIIYIVKKIKLGDKYVTNL